MELDPIPGLTPEQKADEESFPSALTEGQPKLALGQQEPEMFGQEHVAETTAPQPAPAPEPQAAWKSDWEKEAEQQQQQMDVGGDNSETQQDKIIDLLTEIRDKLSLEME